MTKKPTPPSVRLGLRDARDAIRRAVDLYADTANQADASALADHLYKHLSGEYERLYRIEAAYGALLGPVPSNNGSPLPLPAPRGNTEATS